MKTLNDVTSDVERMLGTDGSTCLAEKFVEAAVNYEYITFDAEHGYKLPDERHWNWRDAISYGGPNFAEILDSIL